MTFRNHNSDVFVNRRPSFFTDERNRGARKIEGKNRPYQEQPSPCSDQYVRPHPLKDSTAGHVEIILLYSGKKRIHHIGLIKGSSPEG